MLVIIYFSGVILLTPVFYYFIRGYIKQDDYFGTEDNADVLILEFAAILITILAAMSWPLVMVAYVVTKISNKK